MSVSGKNISKVYILIVAVLCGIIAWFTPFINDDLAYKQLYSIAEKSVGDISLGRLFSDFIDNAINHYLNSNGRLADKVLLLVLWLPRWLFAILTAIASVIIMNAGRFVSPRLSGNKYIIICASLMILCLPWYELAFTYAFSINYVWGCVISLVAYAYITGRYIPDSILTKSLMAILILVGGAWHEGFAVCVGFGGVVWLCVNGIKGHRLQVIYLILWIVGAIFTFASPAAWNRLDNNSSGFSLSKLFTPELIAYYNVTLLYLLAVILSLCLRKFRWVITRSDCSILSSIAAIIVADMLLIAKIYCEARITFFATLFAIPGLLYLILLWRKCLVPRTYIRCIMKWIYSFFAVITLIHLSACVYWQIKLNREMNDVTQRYLSLPSSEILYYDLTWQAPWYTLSKPSFYQLHNASGLESFAAYYASSDKPLRILPTLYKDIDPRQDGKHQGGKFDVYYVGDAIFARLLGNYRSYPLEYTFSDSTMLRVNTLATAIYLPDGTRFAYLEPLPRVLNAMHHPSKIE